MPLYRGAAPVQRALQVLGFLLDFCFPKKNIFRVVDPVLQDGVKETGVSLAFTVRALDSGPIISSHRMEIDDQIKVLVKLSSWIHIMQH